MMRKRRCSASTVLPIFLFVPFALLCGCRPRAVAPPISDAESNAQEIRAADAHPPAFYNALTDDALLLQHDQQGLELALKMQTASAKEGAPIPFRVLIRDRAATVPIAAGLCSGLTLAWQNLDGNTGAAAIDNQRCFNTIPNPDETPLVRGAVKTVEITQRDASNTTLAPGRYLLHLEWQPYAAGRGTIMGRQPYASLRSNAILFTVTP